MKNKINKKYFFDVLVIMVFFYDNTRGELVKKKGFKCVCALKSNRFK